MANPVFPNWLLLVIAPFVGSFLGVLIKRLPENRPVIWARSGCDACGIPLTARDLVPLLSWLWARGRCRYCGQSIGWFYPAVELAAFLIAAIAAGADEGVRVGIDCALGWWLLALGWIDLRHWLLLDALTLPLVVAGLVVTATLDPDGITDHAAAAALGYLALRLVAALYWRLRHREGLGQGDAKLFAAGGAWLGIAALPQVILIAALTAMAGAAALGLTGTRLRTHSALPFGPFLAFAIWLLWLYGPLSL